MVYSAHPPKTTENGEKSVSYTRKIKLHRKNYFIRYVFYTMAGE